MKKKFTSIFLSIFNKNIFPFFTNLLNNCLRIKKFIFSEDLAEKIQDIVLTACHIFFKILWKLDEKLNNHIEIAVIVAI